MAVDFVSTRGGTERASFDAALLNGLAPDGGLYVPSAIPMVGEATGHDYPSLACNVLEAWLGSNVGKGSVENVVRRALTFPVPLRRLAGGSWNEVTVVELFHGPTLSFKDFGARSMAAFFHDVLRDDDERTILVATSGDTGSAVADAFSGSEKVRVVLLYPRGQVSPTQERQLIVRRPGVITLAVDGTFDDCQRMVKEAFVHPHGNLRLSSANSINVGRLLPQMTYYFWAGRRMESERWICCVPSGNLGNLTAGVLAKLSGLGVDRFLAAHNANDFFPTYLQSGTGETKESVRTISNAMDVAIPSNFERLQHFLSRDEMNRLIWSTSVSDAATREAMKRVYEDTGYVADPHTAVGLEAIRRYRSESGDATPVAVMATAHPSKFPEVVEETLGFKAETPDRLGDMWRRDTNVAITPARTEALIDLLTA